MQLKRVAEAKLPTPWGDFLMVGFEELATTITAQAKQRVAG